MSTMRGCNIDKEFAIIEYTSKRGRVSACEGKCRGLGTVCARGHRPIMGLCDRLNPCGADLDSIFSYTTVKYVNILDRRLGVLKVLLTGIIALYVIVFQIWYRGGYLQPEPVNGFARFTLQQPTVNGCDPTKAGCMNHFRNKSSLSYCSESSQPYTGNKLPCRFVDNIGVGIMMTDSIIIGSRGAESKQALQCPADADNCPTIFNQPGDYDRFYVADIERYTLLIDHGVQAPALGLSGESRYMNGRIRVEKGSVAEPLCAANPNATTTARGSKRATGAPCYIAPNRTADGLDVIDVGVLVQAANVDLDDININGETYRETGSIVMVNIEYSNFWGWLGLRGITYVYRVSILPASEYKIYQSFYDPYPTQRTVLNLHGLYTSTSLSGYLYGKSFNYFLIQITTSLTLLAIATTVIDLLAIYIMPDRSAYYAAKYETTGDFSDIRRGRRRREPENTGATQSQAGYTLLPGNGPEGGEGGEGSSRGLAGSGPDSTAIPPTGQGAEGRDDTAIEL